MKTISELELIATQVRRDIIRMINGAKSGHPGGALGCADLITALYFNSLNIDPLNFSQQGNGEDLFFLSNGHISAVWYSVLARRGYFNVSELSTFRQWNTRLQGHPSPVENLPGIRIASGSLGQGISVATGAALSKKMNKDNNLVYVLTGDGELQEGQIWEAFMYASANKIDNLIAIIDYNKKQIDGDTDSVCSLGNLQAKLTSFGWFVLDMEGNDMQNVVDVLELAKSMTNRQFPVAIVMNSHMGMGVDFMLDNHKWHGTPPSNEQTIKALEQLPITLGDF